MAWMSGKVVGHALPGQLEFALGSPARLFHKTAHDNDAPSCAKEPSWIPAFVGMTSAFAGMTPSARGEHPTVMPAQAGIQGGGGGLDSRFRGNDVRLHGNDACSMR